MYKSLFIACLIIQFLGCSSSAGTREESSQDSSLILADNTTLSLPTNEPVEQHVKEDTSQLNARYDERRETVLLDADAYYQVIITTKQYEAVSDVTWYFDSSFSSRYFNIAWSAEGQDGSAEYVIEKGVVVCSRVESPNAVEKWCDTTGGTQTIWSEETGDAEISLLAANYGHEQANELARNLDILKALLNECEIIEQDEGTYTLRKESIVNVGMDYTESVEVYIPKELYEQLK